MENLTLGDIFGLADKITSVGLLLALVIAILTRRLVPWWVLDKAEQEAKDWKSVAISTIPALEKLADK